MRIGDFADRFNVSISTIRYYIKNGVLVPEKKENNQFEFSEKDIREMEIILELKKLFFSIDEIKQYLKVTRVYNDEDLSIFKHLVNIYDNKKANLLEDIKIKQAALSSIDKCIDKTSRLAASTSTRSNSMISNNIGIPIDFFTHIVCPKCHQYFDNEFTMRENKVVRGNLRCSCGYSAEIEDGIFLAPQSNDYYHSKNFKVLHYQEIPPEDADFVFFQYLDQLTEDVITLLHQTYNGISQKIQHTYPPYKQKPHIVFVPDLAIHYLYRNINEPFFNECFKDSFIIVTGFSKENILAIKSHMDEIAPTAKIIYIANTIYELPIKNESIDLWIDATSSYNFAFFHPESLHSKISCYLKNGAQAIGLTKYYEPSSISLQRIKNNYKHELPNHSLLNVFKTNLRKDGFDLTYEKEIGYTTNPGPYYEYHAKGEKHRYLVYAAEKNDKI